MGYNRPRMYTIPILASHTNYGDGVTAYFGFSEHIPTLTPDIRRVYFTRTGIIKEVCLLTHCQNITGSAEDWEYYIRINNTTDYALTTVGAATPLRNHSKSGLDISISEGDYFEIKTVCPTWATNPDGTYTWGYVVIQSP